jgi:YidC/Oxa1 family membrane protein insertase
MSLDFLYTGVSWVLLRWHDLFTFLGLSSGSGLNWSLSIVFLVITARLALFRFFLKQVHYQRNMQAMQPRLQAIREKYKNDRQAQQREMMRLQQEEGFNPLAGCLPMLLQIPIFISLFHVLRHVSNSASLCHPIQVQNAKLSLYGFTATQTCSAADAKLFGAPLAGSLRDSRHSIESTLSGNYTSTLIVTIIVVLISAAATFYSQRLVKAGNPTQPEGTAATVQKLMAVGIPISVVISGLFFPLGVLIYWFTSNAWTMGQQLYINKFHPHLPPPDSAAGTGDEGPINPNGGYPTTPRPHTEPRAPRPGQRPARPPRKRAPAQRKAKTRGSDKQAVIRRWWRCQEAAGQPIVSPAVSSIMPAIDRGIGVGDGFTQAGRRRRGRFAGDEDAPPAVLPHPFVCVPVEERRLSPHRHVAPASPPSDLRWDPRAGQLCRV